MTFSHVSLAFCFSCLLVSPALSFSNVAKKTNHAPVATSNIHFEDWISDSRHEVERTPLTNVEGKIPSFLQGSLIRNGGGMWSTAGSGGKEMYGHIFDGLAKVAAYHIRNGQVEFTTKFPRSNWYNLLWDAEKLPPSITVGPIVNQKTLQAKTGWWETLQAFSNVLAFDNCPVNIWDFEPANNENIVTALTDAPPRAVLQQGDLSTVSTSTQSPPTEKMQGYELLCTTHPEYSKTDDSTYNVGIELGLRGARIVLTNEKDGRRVVVGRSNPTEGVPYMHSFGVTKNYAVAVLQPLRLANFEQLLEKGFLRCMDEVTYTQVLVFDLCTGSVVLDQKIPEKIFFYHAISAAELTTKEVEDRQVVSLRLCAYKNKEMIAGENHFMRLDKCLLTSDAKEGRNQIPKGGTFCDVVCDIGANSVSVDWKDGITQGFELPTTRYSRSFGDAALSSRHPRYVYAFGAYANGSVEYDNWGLFKYDLETERVAGFHERNSLYVSEPIFVANPDGKAEDDGVLLSQLYDGVKQETALLLLDASKMTVLATIWTGQRSSMDFHGAWVPKQV